jgi:hypothetical protein
MNKIKYLVRVVPLIALAGIGLVAVGVPASQGGDAFVAGGRSTRAVALPASASDRAKARGRELATALGLPGVSLRVARLDDRFEHRTYDEVTSFDAAGREVAIARFSTDGRVAMALVLGWHPAGPGAPIARSAVEARGLRFVRAAGLDVAGRAVVHESAGAGGWSVAWQRIVDGAPVRGDGVRISLWADGTFHGLSRVERPLAAAPAHPIAAGAARKLAEDWAARRFADSAGDLRATAVERAWVAPNDAFSPTSLDAPAETLRLAWVVRLEARGALADRLRVVETWLDAADGSVLGGDVVE